MRSTLSAAASDNNANWIVDVDVVDSAIFLCDVEERLLLTNY